MLRLQLPCLGTDSALDERNQLEERGALPTRDIDDLACRCRRRGGEEVGAHQVGDVDEVARLQSVAEHDGPIARKEPGDEARDRRRIFALRILPRAIDIEEAQRDARQAVGPRVRLRVQLAGDLLRGVRRDGARRKSFVLGLLGRVSVRGA